MNQDALMLGSLIVSAILALLILFIARFIFSIGRIVRNQEKIINILSGIAIKQNVDSIYLK